MALVLEESSFLRANYCFTYITNRWRSTLSPISLRVKIIRIDDNSHPVRSKSVKINFVTVDSESQGIDDIMPGLDSNSRVDIDPLAFDLQAQRRAFVRR